MFIVFKTAYRKLEINGKEFTAHISLAWDYDQDQPDFDYGDEESNKAEMKRFESGELANLQLKVTAQLLGETGTDYLGQCFVKASNAEAELESIVNEHEMIDRALIELRGNILSTYNTLKQALG